MTKEMNKIVRKIVREQREKEKERTRTRTEHENLSVES